MVFNLPTNDQFVFQGILKEFLENSFLLLPFLSRSEEVLFLGIKKNSFKGKGSPVCSFLWGSRKGKGTKRKLQPRNWPRQGKQQQQQQQQQEEERREQQREEREGEQWRHRKRAGAGAEQEQQEQQENEREQERSSGGK